MLGVLFDFDGTLANTMQSHYMAWRVTLSKLDIKIEEDDYYPLEGMSMHSIARILSSQNSLSETEINQLVLDKKNYYISSLVDTLYDGVESLINNLSKKKIPIGIVTSSHADQLFTKFNKAFLNQFDVIVTGDQVDHGKPHPQPYLAGAKLLNLNPKECIAVENAPLGVSSAKSAGMYCIGISSTVSSTKLSEANEVISHIQYIESTKGFSKIYKNYE